MNFGVTVKLFNCHNETIIQIPNININTDDPIIFPHFDSFPYSALATN